jgi:hypothetical protein
MDAHANVRLLNVEVESEATASALPHMFPPRGNLGARLVEDQGGSTEHGQMIVPIKWRGFESYGSQHSFPGADSLEEPRRATGPAEAWRTLFLNRAVSQGTLLNRNQAPL